MNCNIDIIEFLINRNLLDPAFQIFCELDINSVVNCRLVCKFWRYFIDYHFYELSRGRKWVLDNVKAIHHINSRTPDFVRNKIFSNVLSDEYEPLKKIVEPKNDTTAGRRTRRGLFHIEADEKSVCASSYCGCISNYKTHTLEHLWSLKIGDGSVQHYMTATRVFAVLGNGTEGNVFVVDRTNGCLLHTLLNVHWDNGNARIDGIRVFDERILATADDQGFIKFHRVDDLGSELISKQQLEEEKLISEKHRYRTGGAFTHLDHDKDKLVSGSVNGELIAWDFKNGKQLHHIDGKCRIYMLKIGTWPLVATCNVSRTNETDDDNGQAIKLFNIENEIYLTHIKCEYATGVNFYGDILLSCGNFVNKSERTLSIRVWNMSEVMDDSIDTEKVGHREISSIPNTHHCSLLMIGSNILTTEGAQLVQRSFLP